MRRKAEGDEREKVRAENEERERVRGKMAACMRAERELGQKNWIILNIFLCVRDRMERGGERKIKKMIIKKK